METRRRWLLLGSLLTATLAAAAWVRGNDNPNQGVVEARESPGSRARADGGGRGTNAKRDGAPQMAAEETGSPVRPDTQVQLERLDARTLGQSTRDPFAVPVRPVPRVQPKLPAPVIVAIAAPPPSAPALPFKYMGKLIDGDETTVFLIQGDRNLVVQAGDIFDAVYRLDRITDDELVLTYLPMNQRQTLNTGAATAGSSR